MPKIVATKLDWIKLGFKRFAESGEVGLNVDQMSRTLKCNKSSFYWHFQSKKIFLNNLIEYWTEKDTTDLIKEIMNESSPKAQFLKLIEISFKKDFELDFIFYLKKIAQKDPEISKLVDSIDRERVRFAASLLMSIGYPQEQASIKANILYKVLIGSHEMVRYKTQDKYYMDDVLVEINEFIDIDYAKK